MRMQHGSIIMPARERALRLPLFVETVSAGFPSPADDYIENKLDLNSYLVKHPAATYFVRVSGDSMIGAGIHAGDILIVDRAVEPTGEAVVVAAVNRELTVKRINRRGDRIFLVPENGAYLPIEITEDMDFEVWGVVTAVIHRL